MVSSSVVNIISFTEEPLGKKINPALKNGTGTIVTSDGIIMTYRSAILDKNARYKVILFDGTIKDAELLGIDTYSQLVFLKIEANNLPTISFANSADAKIGEKIVAIGNQTFSYANTYSSQILGNFNAQANIFSQVISSSEKLLHLLQC